MRNKKRFYFFSILFLLVPCKIFAQVLETEESKPLLPRQFEIGTGLEFQTAKEGRETALPFAIEYGITKKFTLLIEPVAFTNIHPKVGRRTTGIGDLELTLFYQLVSEKKYLPSISVSGEIKIPTSRDTLIGTGKTDFTTYLIGSKNLGKFFTSVNLSYTFVGKPANVIASNLFNYALGTIYSVSSKSILFAEVYGNTSAFGKEVPEGITTIVSGKSQELSGGETVGAIGYGYHLKKNLLISLGISYDNNKATLFRPGIEWKFGGNK